MGRPVNGPDSFWAKVIKGEPDECWLWTAGKDKDGYGIFSVGNKSVRATRYLLGEILDLVIDGCEVRHSCDNPPCCNPAHLITGTTADNAADRETRGRGMRGRKQTPEHVARKAEARRGKGWTPEMRKAQSDRMKTHCSKEKACPPR